MSVHNLIKLVENLRKRCPWDKKQTLNSLKNNIIEESYELIEAIEKDDIPAIEEELGDILFLGFFFAKVFEEEKKVDLESLITRTITKYKDKHPHVFKDVKLSDQDAVLKFWHRHKEDLFSGICKTLPALLAAKIIQERVSKVGFDWESHKGPFDKVAEELDEVEDSIETEKVLEEFGDMLFACVNLARHLSIDPEEALRYANTKFIKRFRKIMAELKEQGKDIDETSLGEMDKLWDEIKKQEAK